MYLYLEFFFSETSQILNRHSINSRFLIQLDMNINKFITIRIFDIQYCHWFYYLFRLVYRPILYNLYIQIIIDYFISCSRKKKETKENSRLSESVYIAHHINIPSWDESFVLISIFSRHQFSRNCLSFFNDLLRLLPIK